jgi:hypothetical protein
MDNRELLRTLSGCKTYQKYLEGQQSAQPQPARPKTAEPQAPRFKRRLRKRVYRKYCFVVMALFAGAVVLVIAPLWLVHPPYGKALLLSLPPMALCAFSWMAGAWWAWDKDRFTFLAVTLGASPARLFLGLGWAWLVLSLHEIPFMVFVLGLMWHWFIFTVPEIAMIHQFNQSVQTQRASPKTEPQRAPSSEARVSSEVHAHLYASDR